MVSEFKHKSTYSRPPVKLVFKILLSLTQKLGFACITTYIGLLRQKSLSYWQRSYMDVQTTNILKLTVRLKFYVDYMYILRMPLQILYLRHNFPILLTYSKIMSARSNKNRPSRSENRNFSVRLLSFFWPYFYVLLDSINSDDRIIDYISWSRMVFHWFFHRRPFTDDGRWLWYNGPAIGPLMERVSMAALFQANRPYRPHSTASIHSIIVRHKYCTCYMNNPGRCKAVLWIRWFQCGSGSGSKVLMR